MKRVLFVCTGNTCRSPMAEALFRETAKQRNIPVEAKSAGISAIDGVKPAGQAVEVLKEKGITCNHSSRSLNQQLIEWADLILSMTEAHKQFMLQNFLQSEGKVYTLKEYALWGDEAEQIQKKLDQLYLEAESIRAKIQAQFAIKADEPWPDEAKAALEESLKPLREQEKKYLEKMNQTLDVEDPFGGSVEQYRKCAEELKEYIHSIIDRWEQESLSERTDS